MYVCVCVRERETERERFGQKTFTTQNVLEGRIFVLYMVPKKQMHQNEEIK